MAFEVQSSLLLVATGCLLLGIGWMFIYGISAASAIASIPKRFAGIATGAFATLLEIGGTIGLAVAGTVFRVVDANSLIHKAQEKGFSFLQEQKESIRDFISNFDFLHQQFSSISEGEYFSSFMDGYQGAMWVLLGVGIFGLITTCFMKGESLEHR